MPIPKTAPNKLLRALETVFPEPIPKNLNAIFIKTKFFILLPNCPYKVYKKYPSLMRCFDHG